MQWTRPYLERTISCPTGSKPFWSTAKHLAWQTGRSASTKKTSSTFHPSARPRQSRRLGRSHPRSFGNIYCIWKRAGITPGGRHAAFRSIRALFLLFEDEVEPEGWSNPIRKVKAPRVPLEPVSIEVVRQMVRSCQRDTFTVARDAAILLCLLDTGARAKEFLSINLEDINQARGDILIRQGKVRKSRTVYIGKQSKRMLRRYLKFRQDDDPALWVTHPRFGAQRMSYGGLRAVFTRRSRDAGVEEPNAHDFRRAFALMMLRNGSIFSPWRN